MSPEQRDKIVDSLATQWKGDVESWLMIGNYAGMYAPEIPDQFITPHLTVEQMSVWQNVQKVSFGTSWNNNGEDFNAPEDEWWGAPIEPKPQQNGNLAAPAAVFAWEGDAAEAPAEADPVEN